VVKRRRNGGDARTGREAELREDSVFTGRNRGPTPCNKVRRPRVVLDEIASESEATPGPIAWTGE
jgi:hypothetical protein